jgi:signal transduction histidine kinase
LGKLRAIDPESLIKTSKSIQHSIDQMMALISNLLDSSKMESGTFTVTKKEENIIEIISSVVEMMKMIAEAKRIQMEMNIQTDMPMVSCEANRITQVISNLLGNAIKFSNDGGKIIITAIEQNRQCIISVSDTGPGIAEEEISKVFDKFWQADKTKKLGSGLGLAIAKGIVEAHGGHIWVDSEQGAGSTFTMTIPLAVLETEVQYH